MIVNKYANGGGGSASGVTPEQVQQQINSALTPYWDSAITESAITEAVSGLATEQYVQDALSGVNLENYWTSAQTEEAISAATSGKADAANVQTYGDYRYFPKWNEQGIITDKIGSTVFETSFPINNEPIRATILRAGWNIPLPHIYAPTTSGNAGEVLVSLGDGGAPVWSAVTMNGTVLKGVDNFPKPADAGDVVSKKGQDGMMWDTSDGYTAKMHIDTEELENNIDEEFVITQYYAPSYSGDVIFAVTSGSDYFWVNVKVASQGVINKFPLSGTMKTLGIGVDNRIYAAFGYLEDDYSDKGGFMFQLGVTTDGRYGHWDGSYTQLPDVELNNVSEYAVSEGVYLFDGERWVDISKGNSDILAAITSQAEYEAISGSVKTGDLIQVQDVDLNGDGPEYGLFQAYVQEIEDKGVITKEITWNRVDNVDSLNRNYKDYPWMTDNDTYPIELSENAFLIAEDTPAKDGSYNGIGFDAVGKPAITHIVPEYDEQTGEITGITREDKPILTDDGSIVRYDIDREAELANAGYNTKLVTQEYDENEGAMLPTIVGYMEEGMLNGVKIDGHSIAKVSGFIHQQRGPTPGPVFDFTQNDELATQAYVTAATENLASQIDTLDEVVSAALVDLNDRVDEKVESQDIKHIVKLTQAEYDALVDKDYETFYIIINNIS